MSEKGVDDLRRVDNRTNVEAGDAAQKQELRHQEPAVSPKGAKGFAEFHFLLEIVIARHFGYGIGHVEAAERGQDANEKECQYGGNDSRPHKGGG